MIDFSGMHMGDSNGFVMTDWHHDQSKGSESLVGSLPWLSSVLYCSFKEVCAFERQSLS